jgi:hypothetical protein
MQTAGNPDPFLGDIIPYKFVPEILDLVVGAWCRIPRLKPNHLEPRITALLRRACIGEYEQRYRGQAWPFIVTNEDQLTDPRTGRQVARTDLEVHIRSLNIPEQRPFFTFEAKRLNIPNRNRVRSNAAEYVGDGGMMCFVTSRYDPIFCGMLGYVMNGNIGTARVALAIAIGRKHRSLRLRHPKQLVLSSRLPNDNRYGETSHAGKTGEFTMHHLFLSRRTASPRRSSKTGIWSPLQNLGKNSCYIAAHK